MCKSIDNIDNIIRDFIKNNLYICSTYDKELNYYKIELVLTNFNHDKNELSEEVISTIEVPYEY